MCWLRCYSPASPPIIPLEESTNGLDYPLLMLNGGAVSTSLNQIAAIQPISSSVYDTRDCNF